jgi:ribonuclease HI
VTDGSGSGEHQPVERNRFSWQPPPNNKIKINWDAALNAKERRIGLGIIARDSRGNFLAARSKTLEYSADPSTAKALAALHAVLFSKERGYGNVIFEGDALQIVNAITA